MVERLAQVGVRIEAEPDADCEELVALAVRLCEQLLPLVLGLSLRNHTDG